MLNQTIGLTHRVHPAFIRDGVVNRKLMYNYLVENAILSEDSTRQVDEAVTRVSRRDLRAIAALRNAGLTLSLKNIGQTEYAYDRITPVDKAKQSMSIMDLAERDLTTFARTAIPVPVTSSTFSLDARTRAAGEGTGRESVSVTNVEESTRSVSEMLEDTLVNGSTITLGANTLPGFTNFASRFHVSLGTPWPSYSPGEELAGAISDVLAMRTGLRDTGFTGPYAFFAPSNWDGVLDEDYKANSDRTLRERIAAIDGVASVSVLPSLPDDNALLVQMTSSVVQVVVGQDIVPITWDVLGGLGTNWAILGVISFALKAAIAREPISQGVLPAATTAAGIAHLS